MEKKRLSPQQGVEAAVILFTLNTPPQQVDALGVRAGILSSDSPAEVRQTFRLHWYGFVHAAVTAALMVHAPNIVVATYLRNTQAMLATYDLDAASCQSFIDVYFSPYMELLLQEQQQQCPSAMIHNLGSAVQTSALEHALATLAATMAMTLSVLHDKLEAYDIQADENFTQK